jgi:hypothetical protein
LSYFADPLHDEFSTWILGFAPYGGGDVGEVAHLAGQVKEGDDDSLFETFSAYAEQLISEADTAVAAGHAQTAHECYLRAAGYLGVAYHPLYGLIGGGWDSTVVPIVQQDVVAGREHALRDAEPLAGQPDDPGLARQGARSVRRRKSLEHPQVCSRR